MSADSFVTNIVLDAAMMPEMSDREKALRDLFVREYLQDYNAIAACLRCGFMRSFAQEYAEKFMSEPYVRQQLIILEQTAPLPNTGNPDADDYAKQRIINGLFREAHNNLAPAAARVSAFKELASIYGLSGTAKPAGVGDNGKKGKQHKGGVIMVPAIADVTEWEDAATSSQEKLVTDARS